MARVMRKGKRHQRNFTLKQFKTWIAAEKAAARWVRVKLKALPPSEMNARDRMTVRNHSGKVGVNKTKHVVRKFTGQAYEYWRWTAHWPGCRNSGGVSWYISRFGDDDAFVLAALTREMESINRREIVARLEVIKGTPEYDEILILKNQSSPTNRRHRTPR
jgi:hypothetical protein